jgi:hypothetical protein
MRVKAPLCSFPWKSPGGKRSVYEHGGIVQTIEHAAPRQGLMGGAPGVTLYPGMSVLPHVRSNLCGLGGVFLP